ncbi:zinc-binding dehydrogenase [Nonomuraea thailandensis]
MPCSPPRTSWRRRSPISPGAWRRRHPRPGRRGDLPQLLEAVAWEGRVVTAGYASGDIPDISLLDVLIRNIAVLGEDIAAYTVREPHRVGDALRTCVGWWRQGAVEPRPPVATMPLEDAAKALTMVAQASAGGKIVLSANSL